MTLNFRKISAETQRTGMSFAVDQLQQRLLATPGATIQQLDVGSTLKKTNGAACIRIQLGRLTCAI